MSNNAGLLAVLAEAGRERRIRQGRDLETNLTATLGRKPTLDELCAESIRQCEIAFGRLQETD